MIFMNDVAARLASRIQLTTDGYKPYLVAVADAFDGVPIDYAMLTKLYTDPPTGAVLISLWHGFVQSQSPR
ncbi:MAG: hypothetical protein ACREQA_05210 [Candidatus Binatia bacterium]